MTVHHFKIWPVYELFLVADWVKALHSESEGSRFQSHKVLGRAFGPTSLLGCRWYCVKNSSETQ